MMQEETMITFTETNTKLKLEGFVFNQVKDNWKLNELIKKLWIWKVDSILLCHFFQLKWAQMLKMIDKTSPKETTLDLNKYNLKKHYLRWRWCI